MKEKMIWLGQEYEMELFEFEDISNLDNVHQIYGFLFDENGKLCIVRPTEDRGWRLPGGKPEKGENWKQTLIREADEEADIDLDEESLKIIGYIKVIPLNENSEKLEHYAIRTIGKITKIKDQTEDIAEGLINERKFISPEEFLKYCPWGNIGKRQLELALDKFHEDE
jgi:ADP-ribose pyrophosphatase YjhB (NUDIX family)